MEIQDNRKFARELKDNLSRLMEKINQIIRLAKRHKKISIAVAVVVLLIIIAI